MVGTAFLWWTTVMEKKEWNEINLSLLTVSSSFYLWDNGICDSGMSVVLSSLSPSS